MYGLGFIVIVVGAFVVNKIRGFVKNSEIDFLINERNYETALEKCLKKAESGEITSDLDYKIFSLLKKMNNEDGFQWAKKIADQSASSKKVLVEVLEYLKDFAYNKEDLSLKFEILLKKDCLGLLSGEEAFNVAAVYGAAGDFLNFKKYSKLALKHEPNNFLFIKLYTIFCFEKKNEKEASDILASYEGSVENKTDLYLIAGQYWLKKNPEEASKWFILIDKLTVTGFKKVIALIGLVVFELSRSDFFAARELIDTIKIMKKK